MSDSDDLLAVSDVQSWLDASSVSCGDCGSEDLTVNDVRGDSLGGHFEGISGQRAELECESCGAVTVNSLVEDVVDEIRGE